MKKLFILLSFFLTYNTLYCQDYFGYRNDIKIGFLRDLIGPFNDTSYYYFEDSKEKLIVTKTGSQKMKATYFFLYDEEFGQTDFFNKAEIEYYNLDLAIKHLAEVLNEKNNKWVKVKENYYITKNKISGTWGSEGTFYRCGEMKIIQKKENSPFKILLNIKNFERTEWKELVKGK